MGHGECTDECESQTTQLGCVTKGRMPSIFGARTGTESVTFTCTDVEYQTCSKVCSDKMVAGETSMGHGECTDECESQTTQLGCVTNGRMPSIFGARTETESVTFTCTDVEYQTCSKVCSDKMVAGETSMGHGK